jgi:hypothetical protein
MCMVRQVRPLRPLSGPRRNFAERS